ncbi:FKBP-type peptidyl-prolyl cis-trans isomerase [Pseudomonas sp. 10B1]|uniref:FKBP-type peptidyl-prolyl cis-trans isomerase n=1 Tax=unclassified Pseudomonas TaxID=196821 RepID=UPI002AB3E81B|nr:MULTISPECIES: FKBP-type peptidyl-prolyl cis-trans isomerase [unclassified Pseudomonas]MDY7562769.1 FKBP-type peptidyl-prolyl cis-trans isomerase [Pseudomonas sp. AB6]MEA9977367.1 FKBP-type peptidyl-prolyl cis-trans isomerase [Pseudomonas sp. RTS4]MEA9994432.1 FKBP-type peptidyl-prolyl cis-trans isomerase [Pseudomonas sp. AA4]MEB0087850.1 FKBP-type peptidyl-prolyl cis-trans isomerase [Pseudomonas sp. RTI1]MEB0126686.1 FKBP-type peptidyl-prolyl cis-trans isomerase [Pseudomonas sp. CCC1.2]
MSRYLLMSLFLLLPLAQAAETAAPASDHDLAYSLGASLGQRLRQEVPDLQIQALIDGLQQAYQGKTLALKEERIEQILRDHDATVTQSEDAPAPASAPEPQSEAAMSTEQRFLSAEKAKPGVQVLADGVLMTELKPGTGPKPTASDRVQVRYVGRLPDGTIFDQNTQPQWFRLDSVIAGWTSALQGMPVGAKWRLVIPSAQAYGAEGAGDLIDPYTPLVFEIELMAVAQ